MKKIAFVYDVDNTLIQGYHPDIILKRRNVNVEEFWKNVENIQGTSQGDGMKEGDDILYLEYLLREVREGKLKGLSVREIEEMGKDLEEMLFPGLPEFFSLFEEVSHHVVSSGIQHLLEGSLLRRYMDSIGGYKFLDSGQGTEIWGIRSTCSSREKISALVKISYGRYAQDSGVRQQGRYEYPFKRMVYFGDQQTDRPVFRFLKRKGGTVICVYNLFQEGSFEKAQELADDVDFIVPADYREGSELWNVANRIVRRKLRWRRL